MPTKTPAGVNPLHIAHMNQRFGAAFMREHYAPGTIIKASDRSYQVDANGSWRFLEWRQDDDVRNMRGAGEVPHEKAPAPVS